MLEGRQAAFVSVDLYSQRSIRTASCQYIDSADMCACELISNSMVTSLIFFGSS